ncbi:wax ester/triacylglycerol synthase domain-containing protein [Actinomycetospora sp. C-140]
MTTSPNGRSDSAEAILAAWGGDSRMSDLEALMWRGERHPEFSSRGIIIEILDSVPDWARFRAGHERGVAAVPRLRSRVVEPAVPTGTPMWVEDPSFDLDNHVRRLSLHEPAGERELLALARTIAFEPMDLTRPLWSGTLVDNLSGGRAAYVLKAHHSLMDGAAMIALFSAMHSDHAEPSGWPTVTAREPQSGPLGPQALALHDAIDGLRRAPARAAGLVMAVGRTVRAPGAIVEFAGSMRRVLSPPAGTKPSPLTALQSSRDWRYGLLECSLADLKAAARVAEASVNDAYIAGLLGGLRRYHEALGIVLGDIPMAMPVSIRRPDDGPGNNHFSAALLPGPAGEADPVERMAAIRAAVLSVRVEPAIDVLGAIAPALRRVPGMLLGLALGATPRVDLTASNVPGMTAPAYAAGARVDRMYVLGPLPNASLFATLVSYVGTCCIGLNADGAVFSDVELLWRCMRDGFDEVLALAGPEARVPEEIRT